MTIWTEAQEILAETVFDDDLMAPAPMTLTPATEVYDDTTDTYTTASGSTIACKGHVSSFKQREIDGSRIRDTDLEVIFQPVDLTATIDTSKAWKLTVDGVVYDVVGKLETVRGGVTALCYKAQIR